MVSAQLTDGEALRRARDAIEEHGWEAVTMEQLAAALGVSRMTLHRRGVRREHVLRALGALLQDDYRRALWPALTAAGSGRERLESGLRGLCGVTEANLALLAALDSAERDEIFHADGEQVLTHAVFTEPLQALLRDGVADGTLALDPGDSVEEVATVLFNLLAWTYRHLRLAHRWPPARAAQAVTRRAVRSVAA
ncbi:regulatory protein TetR [Conexibacter woesei DSM 14684]|uniref:Regulatory protein TetR n=1 Tax=Conexibacter woesei (strain DSM 14684 / CCUG 47730 / CIP 108061 / JCM 11494 / NBRC 100937 / ID131577) TaxID=469383 RepID=D3F018_CONWI|nr:regulatory protein TetR [Conexibacter woesei DSM 14684]